METILFLTGAKIAHIFDINKHLSEYLMEIENIYDRIQYIIDREQLNIASFARAIGVGDQTIRSIVSYRRNFPGYEVLYKIKCAFEWVDMNWLITGKELESSVETEKAVESSEGFDDMFYKQLISSQQKTIENLSEAIKDAKKVPAQKVNVAKCAGAE